jgi:hypothetical protein
MMKERARFQAFPCRLSSKVFHVTKSRAAAATPQQTYILVLEQGEEAFATITDFATSNKSRVRREDAD